MNIISNPRNIAYKCTNWVKDCMASNRLFCISTLETSLLNSTLHKTLDPNKDYSCHDACDNTCNQKKENLQFSH